jgi:hypothetical protein
MTLIPSCSTCWILDDVDADFSAIWELVSVFQQRQPGVNSADLTEQLRHALTELQQHDYLRFYEGIHFNGDEKPFTPVLTADFMAAQAEDWKNQDWSVKQVKLSITDSGRAFFLRHCDSTFFAGLS